MTARTTCTTSVCQSLVRLTLDASHVPTDLQTRRLWPASVAVAAAAASDDDDDDDTVCCAFSR